MANKRPSYKVWLHVALFFLVLGIFIPALLNGVLIAFVVASWKYHKFKKGKK